MKECNQIVESGRINERTAPEGGQRQRGGGLERGGEKGGARAWAATSISSRETRMALPLNLLAVIQSCQLVGMSRRHVPIGGGGEVERLAGGSMGGEGVRVCFVPASGKTDQKRPIDWPAGST